MVSTERLAGWVARFGLTARSLFYCVLVYLVIRLAVDGGRGRQADANGALTAIAAHPGGMAAIAATAVGFFGFGVARIWGAFRDERPSAWRRTTTFLQGAFYVALTWIPLSYVIGNHTTGSDQQHHRTARGILHLPAGRELLFALGLIVVGICVNQIWTGVDQDYVAGMDTAGSPRWVRTMVRAFGTIGIPARAAVFFPIGIFFMVAAVRSSARYADGLDQELALLSHHAWGLAVLALVALGLTVFAVYSFLEAAFRTVTKGQ